MAFTIAKGVAHSHLFGSLHSLTSPIRNDLPQEFDSHKSPFPKSLLETREAKPKTPYFVNFLNQDKIIECNILVQAICTCSTINCNCNL